MKYEDITILTGSPKKVAALTQAYLDEHPNGKILGTAITLKRGQPIEDPEPESPKDKKPATKQAANAPESTTLHAITYGPDLPVVSVTLAREF